MYIVGLTGLIGSGKSTVGGVFCGLGVPLYDCDCAAKELMACELKPQIEAAFGQESYLEDGALNRKFLAQKVFSDIVQLQRLEAIVHPAVEDHLRHWVEQQRAAPYVVVESAILIGNVIQQSVNHLIVVSADREVLISRVMRRDDASRAQVEERLSVQMDATRMVAQADSVIKTSESEPIIPKVVALHEKLLTLSAQYSKK